MRQGVCSQRVPTKKIVKTFSDSCRMPLRPIGEEIGTKKPPGGFERVCMDRFNVRSCQN